MRYKTNNLHIQIHTHDINPMIYIVCVFVCASRWFCKMNQVCLFAISQLIHLPHPCHLTYIPHLADVGQHFAHTVTMVKVIISIGRLVLPYVPKTSLSFHIWLMHGATLRSKNIMLLSFFLSFLKTIIPGILCIRPGILNSWHRTLWGMMHLTLSHIVLWAVFQKQKKWMIIVGKQCFRNGG